MNLTLGNSRRLRLVGILDHPDPQDDEVERRVDLALASGLPCLMLRDHLRSDDGLRDLAHRIRARARRSKALFLVNRRPDLALDVGADGVHAGRSGPPPHELRRRLGDHAVVGYSAHEATEALQALQDGADYVTFSPVFATPSKEGILQPLGVARLRRLCQRAPGRVVALGGIDHTNVHDVMVAGALGVAAIRGVFGAETDTAIAVRALLEGIRGPRSV